MALAAEPSITGYSTRIESPDFLRHGSLDPFRCIYMLNVPAVAGRRGRDPLGLCAPGGRTGVVLGRRGEHVVLQRGAVCGRRAVPRAAWRELPSRPCGPTNRRWRPISPSPTIRFSTCTRDRSNPFIDTVRINTWIPVADDWVRDDNQRKDAVSTIAFLPGHEPFAFERHVGKGHVLAFLTTAGPKWNNWAQNPSVVVFHLELVKHMAREDQTLQRRIVGEPIQVSFNPAEFLETVEITAPDANGKRVTRLTATRPTGTEKPASNRPLRAARPTAPPTPAGSAKPPRRLPSRSRKRSA